MEQNHIIHKVVIEVSVSNTKKAYEIKDNIGSFLTIDVFPKLEEYFTAIQSALLVHTLQVSKLTTTIDESYHSINSDLGKSIALSLKEKILESIKPEVRSSNVIKNSPKVKMLGEHERLQRTFIYFLEKGYMPWWDSSEKPVDLLSPAIFKKIVSSATIADKIAHSLQKRATRERIVNQLSDNQINQLCITIAKAKGMAISLNNKVLKQLIRQTSVHRTTIWLFVLDILAAVVNNTGKDIKKYIRLQSEKVITILKKANDDSLTISQLWNDLTTIFPLDGLKENFAPDSDLLITKDNSAYLKKVRNKTAEQQHTETILDKRDKEFMNTNDKMEIHDIANTYLKADNNSAAIDDKGYHVQNAGLVLIHPFISNLFKYCDLIDPTTQKLTNPEVCIHLLHYIATGKTNQPESGMLFEKFLCNIPLNQSISRHIKLSGKQKAEAVKVISAVQQNWSSMKNASVGLLQHEFFQRPGKLVLNSNKTLTIERKTQDILLDKISWGIGLVKLPWQRQFIYVNW